MHSYKREVVYKYFSANYLPNMHLFSIISFYTKPAISQISKILKEVIKYLPYFLHMTCAIDSNVYPLSHLRDGNILFKNINRVPESPESEILHQDNKTTNVQVLKMLGTIKHSEHKQ